MIQFKSVLLAFAVTTSLHAQSKLKAVELKDPFVVTVLKDYVEQSSFFKTSDVNAFLLLKFEDNGRLIYVGSNNLISYFKSNVPDSYAVLNEHLVFIYDSRASSDSIIAFTDFYRQFSTSILTDVSIQGQMLQEYKLSYFISPSCWRLRFVNEKTTRIQQVYFFPSRTFTKEYTYDEDGHLMYNDGIYASGETPPLPPVGFSLATYLRNNAALDLKLNMDVTITFVIDENGRAYDVKVEGTSDKAICRRIVKAIRSMPQWSPGKVDGRIVKMRDSYGLKEF